MERNMSTVRWLPILTLAGLLTMASFAQGQSRPYIGYVYPAGGQQGTTFPIKLGGQGLDDVDQVIVTGPGVTAKVVKYYRRMGNQEMSLLREQLNRLKRPSRGGRGAKPAAKEKLDPETERLIAEIEGRTREYCNRPACASLSALAFVEVTVAPDAEPGPRELRLATPRGVSNPLPFHIGQVPEFARKPMLTSDLPVLGKEELALRKRPEEEVEQVITVPCTVNGQIACGEVNWYRFEARKGQRLVLSAAARQLIPYIADAVPGWFQPVLAVYDAKGRELAYNDDFRFKPDPVLVFEVPEDGEYRFSVIDALYRGREDFVYRVTIGELPFVTTIFPLGGRVGEPISIEAKGWNVDNAQLTLPPADAGAGVHWVVANQDGSVSNRLPFALDTLPECLDQESNDDAAHAQDVKLPIIINGRIDRSGDWDVFQVAGRAGDTIVAEVNARRLDSPLDSLLKITDASGKLLAFNDDHEDVGTGLNTHHADSYLMFQLPADGTYFVHLGDTASNGGEAYAYRLRISQPLPDFALRVEPSSAVLRSKSAAALNVYALRKDGFTGDIKVNLKNPPEGFMSAPITLTEARPTGRIAIRTSLKATEGPVDLVVEGRAMIQEQEVVHDAVPSEDRMQAFLWRHLVPAEDLKVVVYDPSYQPPPKRVYTPPAGVANAKVKPAKPAAGKPTFTKRQVAGRLRQLKILYEDWLLTDEFYGEKVAECEAVADE